MFVGADLERANLAGAALRQIDLTDACLAGVKGLPAPRGRRSASRSLTHKLSGR